MLKELRPGFMMMLVMTVVTGLIYPAVITGIAQVVFPSQANGLGPLYATGSGSNDADYSNPEFDALYDEGLAAQTQEEQWALFNQAQGVLFQDLPAIPLWYSSATAGYSTLVENVEFGWDSWPLLYAVTKAE
ncbi:MAG: potassium-transporting ATPase subunit C [Rhodoglobus sp.]